MENLGKEAMKTIKRALMSVLAMSGLLFAGAALAVGDAPGGPAVNEINLQPPATRIAEELFSLHMFMLALCTVIFVGVFAVMFYSIFAHRKSKGHKASNFHESTTVEIIWTIVPFVIVVLMALPATKTVVAMKDTTNADLTDQGHRLPVEMGLRLREGSGRGHQLPVHAGHAARRNRRPQADFHAVSAGSRQSAGRPGRQENPHHHHRERRGPLLVRAGLRREAGRDSGFRARHVVQG